LATVIGLGLLVLSIVLKAQAVHRKRLGRVGRRKIAGRIDIEEARHNLIKRKQKSSSLDSITDVLARFLPLLNTTRLRANFLRAGMSMGVGGFVLASFVVAGLLTVMAVFFSGYPAPLIAVPALLVGMYMVDWFVRMKGDRMLWPSGRGVHRHRGRGVRRTDRAALPGDQRTRRPR
jgi:Flp pilus assembly protein TadB